MKPIWTKWEKIDRCENREGTTITYRLVNAPKMVIVQSRKRHIPHANRVGTWDFTSYHVIIDGNEVAKKSTLTDAKTTAEVMTTEAMLEGK